MATDFEYQWGQLVAKAWADPAFKAKLLADPAAVLKEHKLIVPAGLKIVVVENTEKVLHLTLPLPPAPALNDRSAELIDDAVAESMTSAMEEPPGAPPAPPRPCSPPAPPPPPPPPSFDVQMKGHP